MWRASGTIAYRSILKPEGTLTRSSVFRMASARRPVCGTTGGSTVPVSRKLPSFSRLLTAGGTTGCASADTVSATVETANRKARRIVTPPLNEADLVGLRCGMVPPDGAAGKRRRDWKLSVSSRALNQSQASPLDGRSPPGQRAREGGRKVRNCRWTGLLGGALWTVL